MNKDEKIYVAGHQGLVGSAIWKCLQERGYTNLVGRTHKELDLMDPIAAQWFFDYEQPKYVFLAAAHVGGILANSTNRADFIYNNLQIQQNIIGQSFRHQVKKLLFLGSTCIYPRDAPQPIKEEALLSSPLEYSNEPYAIAKIAGLKMCESFNLQHHTNYLSVMPTNLYGPNDNFDLKRSHVLPALIRKVYLAKCLDDGDTESMRCDLKCRPIEGVDFTDSWEKIEQALHKYGISKNRLMLWGSGEPMREFLWSEDMAEACVFLMENVDADQLRPMNKDERAQFHINIGTGNEISIRNLAQLVARTVHYEGCICFDSSYPDGTMRKLTDPSKLQELGWHHCVELEEGVERLFHWYLINS